MLLSEDRLPERSNEMILIVPMGLKGNELDSAQLLALPRIPADTIDEPGA